MARSRRGLGVVALGWLAWRTLGPDLHPRYRGVQRRPLRVPGRSVFVGEREFFLREAGPAEAPPLVLVHGWGFDGEMTFHRVLPALAERFRVIVPDQRGHGKSDRVRGAYEVEDLADDLAGILDAAGITERVGMFGYSLGGMVAQAFAHRYPGRVARLVLGATAAYPVDRYRAPARLGLWLARGFARLSTRESSAFTYRYLIGSGAVAPSAGRWLWEALLARDPTLSFEAGAAVHRFDARPWLGELGMPVMVVIPTGDRVVAVRSQRRLAALLPDPRVVEIVGAGHESILSRPEEYVAALRVFLEGEWE